MLHKMLQMCYIWVNLFVSEMLWTVFLCIYDIEKSILFSYASVVVFQKL